MQKDWDPRAKYRLCELEARGPGIRKFSELCFAAEAVADKELGFSLGVGVRESQLS